MRISHDVARITQFLSILSTLRSYAQLEPQSTQPSIVESKVASSHYCNDINHTSQ